MPAFRSFRRARLRRDRLRSFAGSIACSLAVILGGAATPDVPQQTRATLRDVLAGYKRAIADDAVKPYERMETIGTVASGGLSGWTHGWADGDRERQDQSLGPRAQRVLRLGERLWIANADGNVRELTGILLRRARTERFIASGAFADAPERCAFRGRATLGDKPAFSLDVTAEGGETYALYLDAATLLPLRVAYDDDDGRSTIDFADWRSVDGHRFAFKTVESDGDHAFDTVSLTTSIVLDGAVDRTVFAPFVARSIDMAAAETVPLEFHEGHLYAPVRIGTRTYSFLVDTGAQNILVDTRVAHEVGLTAQGAFEASGATRTGGLQVAKLPELHVGTGTLRDLVVTTLDLGASTSGVFRIDGILGYPFFAAAIVRIDPAARTMTFGPPGSIAPRGEKIAIETDRASPEARLHLGPNVSAPFIVDTGNAGELLLYRPFVDKHPGIVPVTLSERQSYGIGGVAQSYRSTLDELDIGSTALYHLETDVMLAKRGAFADKVDAGNVGLGLLKNFVVTFDESGSAIYVEKSTAFDNGRTRR